VNWKNIIMGNKYVIAERNIIMGKIYRENIIMGQM
jgi:hypothetical protein